MNAAGLCLFMYISLPDARVVTEFMRAVTGWDMSDEELITTGERIATIRHSFNLREGLNPLNYKIPGRSIGTPPLKEGPLTGVTVDEGTMISEYLQAMNWDGQTTKPDKERLLELGLSNVAEALW